MTASYATGDAAVLLAALILQVAITGGKRKVPFASIKIYESKEIDAKFRLLRLKILKAISQYGLASALLRSRGCSCAGGSFHLRKGNVHSQNPLREVRMDNINNSVVGTWKLVSASTSTASGEQNNAPFGPSPTGFLTYTGEGRMMAIVSYGARQNLSVSDPAMAAVQEQAEAFKTFVAYAGRYTLSGEQLIHHVEVSSIQNWVRSDLIRNIRFEGGRMVLTAPPTPLRGQMQTFELIWQRLPANS